MTRNDVCLTFTDQIFFFDNGLVAMPPTNENKHVDKASGKKLVMFTTNLTVKTCFSMNDSNSERRNGRNKLHDSYIFSILCPQWNYPLPVDDD